MNGYDYDNYLRELKAQDDEDREGLAAPDRPGDRDQQQAADILGWQVGETPARMSTEAQQRLDGVARVLARLRETARAEEAARWRVKIEALADEMAADGDDYVADYGNRLRALLDGEL